jgi:hypothetical protein
MKIRLGEVKKLVQVQILDSDRIILSSLFA